MKEIGYTAKNDYSQKFPISTSTDIHVFFINNGFLAQPQYCLTFSWIEFQIFLKCCLKSLVTIGMNEIFSRLTCWGQKLIFLFGNRDKDKHKLCHRERQRWNWSSFFFKIDIYTSFQPVLACDHSQIIILYTSHHITQLYFSHNLFTKFIVIFKNWMDNWIMGLANLEQVVQKENIERIEWYKKSLKWSQVRKSW